MCTMGLPCRTAARWFTSTGNWQPPLLARAEGRAGLPAFASVLPSAGLPIVAPAELGLLLPTARPSSRPIRPNASTELEESGEA